MRSIPRLAVTAGEPSGIGPDLLIQLIQSNHSFNAELVVVADKSIMQQRAKQLGIAVSFTDYSPKARAASNGKGKITVLDINCPSHVIAGELNVDNASYVLETLRKASYGCLNNEFDGMVTAPLHKGIINDAGISFTGHTEFLAELTEAKLPVMMLAADKLLVALATTHLPLKDVSNAITKDSLEQVITILNHDLIHKFGIINPHILICGLNPHAGESGHLGKEEIDTIEPVIESLKNKGLNLTGPLPADTLFTPKYLEDADAVLTMYHDQGLPVLKHIGFGHAVNITLGLPIIRTSVDHGTALDLAGTGKASIGSMVAAINMAIQMVNADTDESRHK